MRAECCKYEFSESRALQKLSLEELSIVNVNYMGAELYECEFYES